MFTKHEKTKVGDVYRKVGTVQKTNKKTDWSSIGAAIIWFFIAIAVLGLIVGE